MTRQDVLSSFTIGELQNPVTARSVMEILMSIDRVEKKVQCKDCKYILQMGDHREVMDDGSLLCEDCANDAEQAAQADWRMKENIQKVDLS